MRFDVYSNRRDDRRNKQYHRVVRSVLSDWKPTDVESDARYSENLPTLDTKLREPVGAMMHKALSYAGLPEDTNVVYRVSYEYNDTWVVVYTFRAERPSEIIDEPVAKLVAEYMIPTLESVVYDYVNEWVAISDKIRADKAATHIADHFLREAEKKAKKGISYNEKLAALDAELKTQVVAEMLALTDDATKNGVSYADDTQAKSDIVDLAVEKAHAKAVDYSAAKRRLPFGTE